MHKGAAKEPVRSTPAWDELEEWTRGRIQDTPHLYRVDVFGIASAEHGRRTSLS